MMYVVKTEVTAGRVNELAQKIINHEIPSVEGNIVFVSTDGRFGYNLVEGASEEQVRQKFAPYHDYITLKEVTPVISMGQFLERWKLRQAA